MFRVPLQDPRANGISVSGFVGYILENVWSFSQPFRPFVKGAGGPSTSESRAHQWGSPHSASGNLPERDMLRAALQCGSFPGGRFACLLCRQGTSGACVGATHIYQGAVGSRLLQFLTRSQCLLAVTGPAKL